MNKPKRKVVEYTTEDGVVVQFHPIRTMTAALLQNKAESKYPDPIAPRIPAPNAADPGVTIADTDNTEYQTALKSAKTMRALYQYALSLDAQLSVVNATQDELIDLYNDVLVQFGATGVQLFDDEPWLNVLVHCAFSHPEDQNALAKIQNGTARLEEVSEEGIAAHVRLFRFVGSGHQSRVRKPTPQPKTKDQND